MPGLQYPRATRARLRHGAGGCDGWEPGTRGPRRLVPRGLWLLRTLPARRRLRLPQHPRTGVSRDGGYATHMLAHASALARVPAISHAARAAAVRRDHHVQRRAHSGARAGGAVAVVHGVEGPRASGDSVCGATRVSCGGGERRGRSCRPPLGAHEYIAARGGWRVRRPVPSAARVRSSQPSPTPGAMQAIVGGLGPNGTLLVIGAWGTFPLDSRTSWSSARR